MKMLTGMAIALALSSVLVLCFGGCSWSLFERDIADMPGVSAPNPDTDNPEGTPKPRPFPTWWCIGILTVGLGCTLVTAKFLPTLTDEVIVATWGAMALKVGIELARDMADTPWVLLIAVLGIMASLAAWKIGRKRGWWGRSSSGRSSSGQPSADSTLPSSPAVDKLIRGVYVDPMQGRKPIDPADEPIKVVKPPKVEEI
jgi:hypothetical protein